MAENDKKLEEMKVTMEQYIDFSGDKIPEEILDKLLIQVVPLCSDRFRWYLNLRSKNNSTIVCGVSGRKNKPVLIGGVAKHPPYFQPSSGCYCTEVSECYLFSVKLDFEKAKSSHYLQKCR